MSSTNVELVQVKVDSFEANQTYDFNNVFLDQYQWSVCFSLNRSPVSGFIIQPYFWMHFSMSNSSCSGFLWNNFSFYLNGQFVFQHQFGVNVEVDAEGGVKRLFPSAEAWTSNWWSHHADTFLEKGENNLTLIDVLYPEIFMKGEANLQTTLGPLKGVVYPLEGSDGIPNVLQPIFPEQNAYYLWIISGIALLPLAEIIRIYGKRILE